MNVHTASRLLAIIKRTIPILGAPIPLPSPSTSPSALSSRLKLLSGKLADVRILLRLFGIIPCYQWFLATHANPPPDPTIAQIVKLQTYANMLYYPLENAAYLGSQSILPMSKRTEMDLWLWSVRFWGVHVGLDLCRLWRERTIRMKGKMAEKEEDRGWEKRWWAQVVMNLAYAPLTVHWSLENGLGFRDVDIGYFGVIAAVASIYLGWPS